MNYVIERGMKNSAWVIKIKWVARLGSKPKVKE